MIPITTQLWGSLNKSLERQNHDLDHDLDFNSFVLTQVNETEPSNINSSVEILNSKVSYAAN